ncbi:MAG: glycyl radical protein [Anaerolineaceae bacterium]|nr:glycyl radical protein [Anaerolineaceae bacterium]
MNERVRKLRQASLEAVPTLSDERAMILTRFYQAQTRLQSVPQTRAQAFAALLAEQTISIQPGELIVGERGPAPAATSTYPEICCHSLRDLDILDSREKIAYRVGAETRQHYQETVIPHWRGRSMRDLLFQEMSQEWIDAYEAGIFTEFMEQRAPGHTVLDDKIYRMGMLDFIEKIDRKLDRLDFLNDSTAYDQREELLAMRTCARALIHFGERYADLAKELAAEEPDSARKTELLQIEQVCRRVPAHAPRTFHEALQYYWFVHLGVIIELNPWDAFNPGHLDQHLAPFYQQQVEAGTLNEARAKELLSCFWIKFNNQPAPAKIGVTAQESGTYTDFANINTGGVTVEGEDAVNPVTYLILDVIEEMRLLQPSSNIQLSSKNPDTFLRRALEIVRTGFGQPSLFNADMVVEELLRQGKRIEDARGGGTSGCVETGAFGKENYNLTGYFNLVKVLEITLHNGIDPESGRQIGLLTGAPERFADFDDFWIAFLAQLNHFIEIKVRGNNIIERLYARYLPVPFLSLLIDDCIERGKDYHDGGARYNTSYIQGVGIGSATDFLAAIQYHVFDRQTLSMPDLLTMLSANFAGYERERLMLRNKTPKYGNDDDYADALMRRLFDAYFDSVAGRPNTKGGQYEINLLPTTVHVYFGSVVGATPDGRFAGMPLSEGISPVQGVDRRGPTAVLRSAAKMDHARTGGTLLNQKFTPQLLADENGITRLMHLVRTYFRMGGHHVQFNVIDAATLRKAQANPEQYRSLIVRVAGYSDYFCNLSETLQEEIIARTEHQAF